MRKNLVVINLVHRSGSTSISYVSLDAPVPEGVGVTWSELANHLWPSGKKIVHCTCQEVNFERVFEHGDVEHAYTLCELLNQPEWFKEWFPDYACLRAMKSTEDWLDP